jgi:thiosulfate/3-mercaptopyruvate sulfurtransferase
MKSSILAVLLLALSAFAQNNELPPGSPQLIQPEDLAKIMQPASGQKPVVLYVGPHTFYAQSHIPGAEYIGPVAKPEGMDKLRSRAKSLAHDSLVVIYCGCCPWDHCPNIRPAYRELEKMGFTKLRVLYLATSFGNNWTDQGYPVAKGE